MTAKILEFDINRMTLDAEQLRAQKQEVKTAKKQRKAWRTGADEVFVQLPYRLLSEAYGKLTAAAYAVLIELEHQSFINFGKNRVKLTNCTPLGDRGMHRNTKAKALRQLQAAGFITYVQEGKEAFSVTLLWHQVP
jgi:hypothetical protein